MRKVKAFLQGGLGNQCFIYATARSVALQGEGVVCLNLDYLAGDKIYKRTLSLENFNCAFKTSRSWMSKQWSIVRRFRYALLRDKISRLGNYCCDKRPYKYMPLPETWRGTLTLDGYWQSEKYFYAHRKEIVADFRLKDESWIKTDSVARAIKAEGDKAAFVHVRSYKEVPGKEDGACARALFGYYQKAIRLLQEKVPGMKMFLFSDDIPFARELLPEYEFVETRAESTVPGQLRDFTLMRMCKHGIVADSSFSWWAGWLGEQEHGGIRVRPDRRVMNDDFWPERWLAV